MNQLKARIENLFKKNIIITLTKGGSYKYIKLTSTKINGKVVESAFEYQISETNKKRVTINLIDCLYKIYQKNGKFPERNELTEPFITEIKLRPCNYSVAKFIVAQLILEDNLK